MPYLTQAIDALDGPVVIVQIGVSDPREQALIGAQKAVPQPVTIRALVDTGASGTCVDTTVLQKLQLTPSGYTEVHTSSTGKQPHNAALYDVSVALMHPDLNYKFTSLSVMETLLTGGNIQALIGRDVLEKCLLIYDGHANTFSLAF